MRPRVGLPLVLSCLAVLSASPARSSTPQLIAFDRTADGSGRVAIVRATGGAERIITPRPGNEAPVWSPDGSRLVYMSGAGFSDSDLYVAALATGRLRRLTAHAGLDAFPAWSPDGSRIAWTASRGGHLAIWVMAGDGSHKRRLTSGTTAAANPSWSPDGRSIAFVEMPAGSLEVMRADGRGRHRVGTLRVSGGVAAPAWSPDGRRIAIAGADGALYTIAVDGHGLRRLTARRPRTIAWRLAWSPSGKALAFVNLAPGSALDVVAAAGGPVRTLAPHTDGLSGPSWSPDGGELAFADGTQHISIVASDGSSRRAITRGPTSDADPVWRPRMP
jgi:TolB protein